MKSESARVERRLIFGQGVRVKGLSHARFSTTV